MVSAVKAAFKRCLDKGKIKAPIAAARLEWERKNITQTEADHVPK